jgi:hypothetical protein
LNERMMVMNQWAEDDGAMIEWADDDDAGMNGG